METMRELRVGYIIERFPKLSESFITNEIAELMKLGVDVAIFSLSKPNERIMHEEVKRRRLLKRTFYCSDKPYTKGEKFSYILKNLASFSRITSSPLPFKKKICLFPNLVEIAKNARSLGINLLHAHFAARPTVIAMYLSKILKLPYTFSTHGYDIFSKPNFRLLHILSLHSTYVTTPSSYNKNYLNKFAGINSDKIKVVRACVNVNKYCRMPEINRQRNLILTGCRLVEQKGLSFLIMALGKLVPKYPNLSLKIFGTGKEETKLRALVSQFSLENYVHFLGNIPDMELLKLYNQAWMYVLPCIISSDGNRDVCPLTLQEAMACQTPVVSTNIASIPELIEDGCEGFLIEQKNVEQLQNAIETLFGADESKLTEMGKAGRNKVESEFNPHKNAEMLLQIFNSVRELHHRSWSMHTFRQ